MEYTVSVTHSSGMKKTFTDMYVAAVWLRAYKKKRFNVDDLTWDTEHSVDFFDDKIPQWATELILRIERETGVRVPSLHWIEKNNPDTRGFTNYQKNGNAKYISISAGWSDRATRQVIVHEWAHAICGPVKRHGRDFYRILFPMLQKFLAPSEVGDAIYSEFQYKTTSRYWYFEMTGNESVIKGYYTGPVKSALGELFNGSV